MDWGVAIFAILGAQLLGAMTPGPSFVQVVRTSIAEGRAEGIAVAVGLGLGALVFALLALAGLREVLDRAPQAYLAFQVLGGLYLLSIAWRLLRGARARLENPPPVEAISAGSQPRAKGVIRACLRGVATQMSNPKIAVVFASIFAALMPGPAPGWVFLVLPPGIFLQETLWNILVALVFSSARPRAAYARAKTWVDGAAGLVIGTLGARLIWDALTTRSP
ncbi:MAG: LysE family translocator [Rhodospirillum sp.]|nr:LysE family translocator [Rhodospirillum sp.]MCF8488926.1 LysE family translocator [Rhodospirillum sp.]MCF8498982.1 LysE family translocator [Rhodospirillum sp.]